MPKAQFSKPFCIPCSTLCSARYPGQTILPSTPTVPLFTQAIDFIPPPLFPSLPRPDDFAFNASLFLSLLKPDDTSFYVPLPRYSDRALIPTPLFGSLPRPNDTSSHTPLLGSLPRPNDIHSMYYDHCSAHYPSHTSLHAPLLRCLLRPLLHSRHHCFARYRSRCSASCPSAKTPPSRAQVKLTIFH